MDPGQVHDAADLANEMIFWNCLVEPDLVEQLPLLPIEPPPSWPAPAANRITATESLFAATFNGVLQHYRPIADFVVRGLLPAKATGHVATRRPSAW